MPALDYFLGAPTQATRVTPDGLVAPRTVLRGDGVPLHLQEDEYAEQIILFSLPGTLLNVQWLAGASEPWRHGLPHPRFAGVQSVLTVEPGSGQIYLIDVCQRAALHLSMFDRLLDDHAERHRTWQLMLEKVEEDDEEEEQAYEAGDDEDDDEADEEDGEGDELDDHDEKDTAA